MSKEGTGYQMHMERDEKIPISSKVQGRNYFPNA
jgi:hypothetical protein